MRSCAQANIGLQLPVFEIMNRLFAGKCEIGNFILHIARPAKSIAPVFIGIGHKVFIRNRVCMIPAAMLQDFPAQPALIIDFEEIDRNVFWTQGDYRLDRMLPGCC